ncbi:MAG: T9SS type A sorting domain-containing protein [Bacteroidetes bacterium]|nr:T9SS type A sorting domain-containing protein [Bacteroidota bacterium]
MASPSTSNGFQNVDDAFGTVVSSTGNILVSGFSTQPNFSYDAILLKYDTTGVLDPAFGIGGIVVFSENVFEVGFDLVEQADGKSYLPEIPKFPPASNDFLLARYLPNGSPDPTFGLNRRVINSIQPDYDEAEGIALQADGKAILVGKSYNGTQNDIAVARFLTDAPSLLQDMNFAGTPIISPNPVGANKVIRISNLPLGFENMELKLLSIDGKQIAAENIKTTFGVDVEFSLPQTMAKGIYVIEITNENSYGFRKKLIVTE